MTRVYLWWPGGYNRRSSTTPARRANARYCLTWRRGHTTDTVAQLLTHSPVAIPGAVCTPPPATADGTGPCHDLTTGPSNSTGRCTTKPPPEPCAHASRTARAQPTRSPADPCRILQHRTSPSARPLPERERDLPHVESADATLAASVFVTVEPEPFPSLERPYRHLTVDPPHHEHIRTATLAALCTRRRPCSRPGRLPRHPCPRLHRVPRPPGRR